MSTQRHMRPDPWTYVLALVTAAALSMPLACRREPTQAAAPPSEPARRVEAELVFPAELRVADAAVNDFVAEALRTCASGDYHTFRLLWSARTEPLPREEYERGWKAVQRVEVMALRQVRDTETQETLYICRAHVALDPSELSPRTETQRDVVLAIVPEQGAWKLAPAPPVLRDWITEGDENPAAESGAADAADPAAEMPERP